MNSLKKDTIFVYIGYVLRYLGLFILIPYYSRVLGPDIYGQVLAATSLMAIVMAIVSFGFSFSGARDLASAKTQEIKDKIFSSHLLGRALLLPIAIIIGLIGTYISPVLSGNISFGIMAILIGIINAYNFGWLFQGVRKFKVSILIDTLFYPLNIIIALTLVQGPDDGFWALFSLLTAGIICLIAAYIVSRKYVSFTLCKITDGLKEIKGSTILFLSSMSFTILTSGAAYILSTFASETEVGYFGTAEKFVALALNLLIPMGQILMPTVSNLYTENKAKAQKLARKGVLLESLYGFAAPIIGICLAPILIPLILGDEFEKSVLIFQVMICCLPFAAFKHATALYILIPLKKDKYYLLCSLVNVVTNLVIAFTVAPIWGGLGMAVARVISELFASIVMLIILRKLGLLSLIFPNQKRKGN